MHDFVRETSLTTEEWMYAANDFFILLFHFICLDLAVGRLLISSPRRGRCVLIFVKVCFKLSFTNGSRLIILISHIEFILLSDTLGVSTLVDSINSTKPPGATEATVLGPFYTEDAHERKKLWGILLHNSDSFFVRFHKWKKATRSHLKGKAITCS